METNKAQNLARTEESSLENGKNSRNPLKPDKPKQESEANQNSQKSGHETENNFNKRQEKKTKIQNENNEDSAIIEDDSDLFKEVDSNWGMNPEFDNVEDGEEEIKHVDNQFFHPNSLFFSYKVLMYRVVGLSLEDSEFRIEENMILLEEGLEAKIVRIKIEINREAGKISKKEANLEKENQFQIFIILREKRSTENHFQVAKLGEIFSQDHEFVCLKKGSAIVNKIQAVSVSDSILRG